MNGEKEMSIDEKKFFLLSKFFCGNADMTDLIAQIRITGEPGRKKSR